MKAKVKKIFKITVAVLTAAVMLSVGLCIADDIYQKSPHNITTPEEIKSVVTPFNNLPIESCDCIWRATVMFMGGALEATANGKIVVSREYYDEIISKYEWQKSNGVPYQQFIDGDSEEELNKSMIEFLSNNSYLTSEEYNSDMYMKIYLSETEPVVYFYYYDY